MKVFSINAVPYGSTGGIMHAIQRLLESQGHTAVSSAGFTWRKWDGPHFYMIGSIFTKTLHMLLAKLTGYNGCFSRVSTRALLKEIDRFDPDVIHLHNLHGWYVNLPMLFGYLKRKPVKVVWTLHDCWALTGQCPHFTMVKCDKWKTGCHHCPQYRQYPDTYVDRTKTMWKKKKQWFSGLQDLTIVTPSHWLAGLVGESFLKEYPVQVIHNGVDVSVFQPTEGDFRERYGITPEQYVIVGVAFDWSVRKGLDVFVDLAKELDDRFRIVLVGANEKIDAQLPGNIISIHRTLNQQELAEIYTAADVFANPTREEVLGLVNLEALCCGTPVVTFRSGGSPECVDETCGSVVDCDDTQGMKREIVRICTQKPYAKEACIAHGKKFDKNHRFEEYIKLYEQGCKKEN